MLDLDLIHADVELFSQQGARAGIDPLAHLDLRHDQADRSFGVDADKGVRGERRMAVRERERAIVGLRLGVHEGPRLAGAEPDKGERETAELQGLASPEIDRAGVHETPAPMVCGPCGWPVAACLMAARMRT